MNNIKELRNELRNIYEQLKDESITSKQAKILMEACTKIMVSIKVQMDYAKLTKKDINIEFMDIEFSDKDEPEIDFEDDINEHQRTL